MKTSINMPARAAAAAAFAVYFLTGVHSIQKNMCACVIRTPFKKKRVFKNLGKQNKNKIYI